MNLDSQNPLNSVRPAAVDAASSSGKSPVNADVVASGAAFKALLGRLEENAAALHRASESIDDPKQLGAVVENARVSVEEALTLGSDLLEAFRAAQQRAAGAAPSTQAPPPTTGTSEEESR